ncbi:hypothetical protein J4U02_gp099 [Mycobacterium phage Aziz]|uniref:Uncharacterized protein n=1 Tax=Mycobacterium phage Aziz TaxID=2762281 RepID=A0A7G8LHN7_9CAUD|nr:hypothetical protein J4U02_gp099 [Mycobacterium phage Aziz]ASR75947.1 hypothetical protein SEA_GENEVAB15_101 [Mycobacterium phage GenevaB15]QNJ56759.1 hypothetical protein SEA_AZIZ_99 [Mycobacterium phage Aziz]
MTTRREKARQKYKARYGSAPSSDSTLSNFMATMAASEFYGCSDYISGSSYDSGSSYSPSYDSGSSYSDSGSSSFDGGSCSF